LSTETATNPETGVAGQGDNAPSDDIDTEAFDRAPAPDDDASDTETAQAAEGGEGGDEPDKPEPVADAEEFLEVEHGGKKLRIPKDAEPLILMQRDYTQKTTEVAEQRRALEEEKTTWESQREESRAALPEEHARVAVLGHSLAAVDKQLETFKAIDWDAWRNQVSGLPEDDPGRVKYEQYRDA
jgi:hypothetical protein